MSDSQTTPCRTVAAVQADLEARSVRGLAKYGVTLGDAPLTERDLIQHAYEEALDLACYLRTLLDKPAQHPAE